MNIPAGTPSLCFPRDGWVSLISLLLKGNSYLPHEHPCLTPCEYDSLLAPSRPHWNVGSNFSPTSETYLNHIYLFFNQRISSKYTAFNDHLISHVITTVTIYVTPNPDTLILSHQIWGITVSPIGMWSILVKTVLFVFLFYFNNIRCILSLPSSASTHLEYAELQWYLLVNRYLWLHS